MNYFDFKTKAIFSLSKGGGWSFDENNEFIVEWHSPDIPQPTDAEIQAEVIRLQELYDIQEYARSRKAEYDQLNQDELRFDDLENGTTVWQDTINEIKGRYPK
jgi:hypothetical protein